MDSSSDAGIMLAVDTMKEACDFTPPMTSPGLIHDIMGAKPLSHKSLIDHPLMKPPVNAESKTPEIDENRNQDARDTTNIDEGCGAQDSVAAVEHSKLTNEAPSPLPLARMNREYISTAVIYTKRNGTYWPREAA